MYTLFIGGIIAAALLPLLKGTRKNVFDSQNKTFWDKAGRIEQDIQQAKDKVLHWGFYLG
jgi:hypothetical protein